jgi:hypothetical protein
MVTDRTSDGQYYFMIRDGGVLISMEGTPSPDGCDFAFHDALRITAETWDVAAWQAVIAQGPAVWKAAPELQAGAVGGARLRWAEYVAQGMESLLQLVSG